MSKLNLVLTSELGSDFLEEVRAGLDGLLEIGEAQFYLRLSANGGLSQFIQIIGDAAAWLPLKAAATVYLSVLAKHGADATKDWLGARLKRKDVEPLASVVLHLETTANKVDCNVEFVFSLPVPDDFWGTGIRVRAGEPEESARHLATFVVHAEAISELMQEEVEAGRAPLGPALVEMQDDGSVLVKWRAQRDR